MGGKVLELESDKLIQEGVKRGLERGIAKSVCALLHKGKTVAEIADLLDLTVEYVRGIQEKFQE